MNTYGFIIPTYNPDISNIRHLIDAIGDNKLYISNNGDHINLHKSAHISYIYNARNLGFAGGVNIGIKQAISDCCTWIILLNQDILCNKRSIQTFIHSLDSSCPGIYGPFCGSFDKKRWTTINSDTQVHNNNIGYISGAFLAIHASVVRKIGLFYEPYFMYYEDADYSLRAKKQNIPIQYIHVPNLIHPQEPTLGRGSKLHEYYLSRNHLLFLERNAPKAVCIREFIRFPYSIFHAYKEGNTGKIRGLQDYILRKFGKSTI